MANDTSLESSCALLLESAKKNSILCKFAICFADSKSRAQELSNDVSFVIFGHQTWDLEGGGQPPPSGGILVFKYPSRDRVKQLKSLIGEKIMIDNSSEVITYILILESYE